MSYRFLADVVVVFHFAVVLFVIGGATLVLWRRWAAWVHLPVVAWVIFAECFHRICPLTYLENWLRARGGDDAYRGDFVAHYIVPVLYPDGLTPRVQVMFGALVCLINLTLYALAFRSLRRHPGAALSPHREPLAAGKPAAPPRAGL